VSDNSSRVGSFGKEVRIFGSSLHETSRAGVDHVLEMAGGKGLSQPIQAFKPGGQISLIGILDGFFLRRAAVSPHVEASGDKGNRDRTTEDDRGHE
jgi:NADPH:quinone reductase-like Zn-dependent oxidoreductase